MGGGERERDEVGEVHVLEELWTTGDEATGMDSATDRLTECK